MTKTITTYDFIIIGSGASGSVLAHYLSTAGAHVCLLEAGKSYPNNNYPDNELSANAELLWNGGLNPTHDARTLCIRGKAVGGGTIVNNCLLDRFDDLALNDFRSVSGVSFYSREEMDRHYQAIESQLCLQLIEEPDWNRNAQLFAQGCRACGIAYAPFRRGQKNCNHNDCMRCLGGCPRGSKQSMAVTFLPKALAQGTTLLEQFHVHRLIHQCAQITVEGFYQGKEQRITGRRCILAAGSLGTTELLLKSGFGKNLPALGRNFFCHPQFITTALMDEPVDAHKGYFQGVKSSDTNLRESGIKLESVFLGPAALALTRPGHGQDHQRFMADYRNLAGIELSIRDQTPGTLYLDNANRLVIKKTMAKPEQDRKHQGQQLIRDIFSAVGARSIMESPLCLALHLMGGCTIGQDEKHSVVNEQFQVHGHRNLFIADSSIYPLAPGINPSLTIMAQSHKASEVLLQEAGHPLTACH